jgi:hypothetical protein
LPYWFIVDATVEVSLRFWRILLPFRLVASVSTEREFDRAVVRRKHRLAFIKEGTEYGREPKEEAFVRKVEGQVKRSKFAAVGDLMGQVYASLIRVLEQEQVLASRPFDAQPSSTTFRDY